MIKSLISPLITPLITPLLSVIRRVFMTFTPSLSTFGTFSTTLSATGDFDYTVKITNNGSASTEIIAGFDGANFLAKMADNSTKLFINNVNVSSIGIGAITDGKFHTIRFKRAGTSTESFLNSVSQGTIITAVDELKVSDVGRIPSGLHYNGVIADLQFIDLSGPIVAQTFPFNAPTASPQSNLEGTNTVTYSNFPASSLEVMTKQQNGDFLGAELVVNGGFNADTDWTKGAGWTISGGVAAGNTLSNQLLTNSATTEIGPTYIQKFGISNYTSGNVTFKSGTFGATRDSDGEFTSTVISISTEIEFSGNFTNGFIGNIDNASVKRVLLVP